MRIPLVASLRHLLESRLEPPITDLYIVSRIWGINVTTNLSIQNPDSRLSPVNPDRTSQVLYPTMAFRPAR